VPTELRAHLAWLGLALALALFWLEFAEPLSQLDDAYISYRYARNWLLGRGLVFNPGEYVEGVTNLGWVWLLAGGMRLGFEAPQVGHALGLLSGSALLAATAVYARRDLAAGAAWGAGVAPLLLLASLPFAKWVASGMETPLFAAACVAALAARERERDLAAAALALGATLLRPDGALVAAVVLAGPLAARLRREPARGSPLALYAAGAGALTLFRLLYYGQPVPNTFYAKVGGIPLSTGLAYLGDFLAGHAWLLPGALFATWRLPGARPGSAFVALLALYCVAVGGDAFGHSRFLLPALAVLCAQAVRGAAALHAGGRPALALGLALCLPAQALWSLSGAAERGSGLEVRERARRHNRMPDAWPRLQAQRLQALEPPVQLVAAMAIGRLGYHADLPILDLFGLTDPRIARGDTTPSAKALPGHQRSDAGYVLARRPDVILIPRRPAGGPRPRDLPAVIALWQSPELERLYRWEPQLRGYRLRDPSTGR
jgi:hypothetical protein